MCLLVAFLLSQLAPGRCTPSSACCSCFSESRVFKSSISQCSFFLLNQSSASPPARPPTLRSLVHLGTQHHLPLLLRLLLLLAAHAFPFPWQRNLSKSIGCFAFGPTLWLSSRVSFLFCLPYVTFSPKMRELQRVASCCKLLVVVGP